MVVEEEIARERVERALKRRLLEQSDQCMMRDIEGWLVDRPDLIMSVVLYLRDALVEEAERPGCGAKGCEGQRKTEASSIWRSMP